MIFSAIALAKNMSGTAKEVRPSVEATVIYNSEGVENKQMSADDRILIAQGHAPVLRRSFNLLGSLGLGFRYFATYKTVLDVLS
jgi:hypothetical protein